MLPSYFIGLDVGQAGEYTACAVLERTAPADCRGWHYALRLLKRFQPGTPHETELDWLGLLMRTASLQGATLVVDQTSVGRPVVDAIRQADLPVALRRVIVSAGPERAFENGCHHVPKRELVSVLQLVLQGRRLKIAEQLPDAEALCQELLAFRAKPRLLADESLENWRERPQDDLVLAIAIAVWMAEREKPPRDESEPDPPSRRPAWYECSPDWEELQWLP